MFTLQPDACKSTSPSLKTVFKLLLFDIWLSLCTVLHVQSLILFSLSFHIHPLKVEGFSELFSLTCVQMYEHDFKSLEANHGSICNLICNVDTWSVGYTYSGTQELFIKVEDTVCPAVVWINCVHLRPTYSIYNPISMPKFRILCKMKYFKTLKNRKTENNDLQII